MKHMHVSTLSVICASTFIFYAFPQALRAQSLTSYPKLIDACYAFVQRNRADASLDVGQFLKPYENNCVKSGPIKLSVTHENEQNNHVGAKNEKSDYPYYMADFDYDRDFNRWLKFNYSENIASLGLDTINYQMNSVTGWPLSKGHLFFGLNDTFLSPFSLEDDVIVELKFKYDSNIIASENKYSGFRILIGTKVNWPERERSNKDHYMEYDLFVSEGFASSYNEAEKEKCDRKFYTRCFFDKNGIYAEGRSKKFNCRPSVDGWQKCIIPLTETIRSTSWHKPPENWSMANAKGVYLAVEVAGLVKIDLKFADYDVKIAQ